ncbi:MAG: RecX family transcriptional regulator [Acidobacteriota bacterium]|nr:RecX family transcriptional regulator [Acidobacteriota bacterium]
MAKSSQPDPTPFSFAASLIARRARSVAEVRRALEKKFPGSEAIEPSIARLRELGYLDDRKFACQYASFLARRRGFGPGRVRLELKSRLVDYHEIDEALQQAYEDLSERSLLERALDKKLRTLRLPLTRRRFYSLAQSISRLGFPSDDIMKAMRSRPELKPVSNDTEPGSGQSM